VVQRERFSCEFSQGQKLKTALFAFAQTRNKQPTELISKNPKHALNQSGNSQSTLFLESHHHEDLYGSFDALLALNPINELRIEFSTHGDWHRLSKWQNAQKDWCFGHLAYDFKNAEENLQSQNRDGIGFPEAYFFVPERLFMVQDKSLTGLYHRDHAQCWPEDLRQIQIIYDSLLANSDEITADNDHKTSNYKSGVEIKGRWSFEQYREKFLQIQKHIQRGDIYETNFCQEFYHDQAELEPYDLFERLNNHSKAPFSAFYKLDDRYALCASPERYLNKKGKALMSQPIKGTLKRLSDSDLDKKAVVSFMENPKERRENIMITDLVRNDLSKVAARDSVKVQELCVLKSYAHVHQLVTTITAELKDGFDAVEALKATFPMGSMTGVPKIRALQLMDDFENHKRGLYSGTIGYFTPEGDFDFNVVIRTLLYNATTKYLSLSVGGALTSSANAQDEYQECLLKAEALRSVLSRG
jgi:para-aminobenzoate synthetase component 1